MKNRVKATFAIPEDELNALRDIAKLRGISVTDALRQALMVDNLISKELDAGNKLIIENTKGVQKEVSVVKL
jgi:hypothetical protein